MVDLLQPGPGDAAARRDEVLCRLAELLRRLLVARHALVLRWEPVRRCYTVWRGMAGSLRDTSATIPTEAEPLPLVTALNFGLCIAHPAESQQLDSSLRQVLGQRPALLLPLAAHPVLTGVMVLDLVRTPHDGEMALALVLAHRAMAVIDGGAGTGRMGQAGERPPHLPHVQEHSTPAASELTPREREVLRLLAAGFRNKGIASALGISERTVTFHLGRIFAKLDVESRTELLLRVLV